MLLAQLWGNGRQNMCPSQRRWCGSGRRAISRELVELFALLLGAQPTSWWRRSPPLWPREPPPLPLKLHGRYSRAEVFRGFGY